MLCGGVCLSSDISVVGLISGCTETLLVEALRDMLEIKGHRPLERGLQGLPPGLKEEVIPMLSHH